MNNMQDFIKINYGIEIFMQAHSNHIGKGNVFIGYNNNLEYIIKIEHEAMASIITELMMWAKTAEPTLACFPRFLQTINGNYYAELDGDILSIQHKETVQDLTVEPAELPVIGMAIGEFHQMTKNRPSNSIPYSSFYHDFMFESPLKSQSKERLAYMESFYEQYAPDYSGLTKGICHND